MVNPSLQYLVWHYRYGLPNLFSITAEFVRFVFNFFSINLFLRTLFRPILSLQGSTRNEEFVPDVVSIVIGNFIMRVIGFMVRTLLIVLGVTGIALTLLFMIALIALWILIPVVLLLSVYSLVILFLK